MTTISVPTLQRRFKIGYHQARRLLLSLQRQGVVGKVFVGYPNLKVLVHTDDT